MLDKPDSRQRDISVADVGRSLLNSAVLIATSLLLLAISCIAFLFFYHHNVPALGVQRTAHLQYHTAKNPTATVDLEFSTSQLSTSQPYDVIVELVVPNTQTNHDLGNFMVEVDLLNTDTSSLINSARPTILRYASPLISTVSTVLTSAPILLGWRQESQTLHVPLLEAYSFQGGWISNPSQLRLEIHAPSVRVYKCTILFRTRMQGLAWFLSSFKVLAFFLFTALFWISSVLFMLGTWGIITFVIFPSGSGTMKRSKGKGRMIKTEEMEQVEAAGERAEEDDEGDEWKDEQSSTQESSTFFDFDSRNDRTTTNRRGDSRRRRRGAREGSVETDATSVTLEADDPFVKIKREEESD